MEWKEIERILTPAEAQALFADADLGRRVREMLAGEDPPPSAYTSPLPLWHWLRRELLGKESTLRTYPWGEVPNDVAEQAPGSLATGGATGEPETDRVRHGSRIVGYEHCDCGKPEIRPEDAEHWPCGARKDEEEEQP